MVPLDPERDFHQIGGIFPPVASIWACFKQKRIFRHLVYVSWSVHQITYFLEIVDLVSKKKFKPQEIIEMDHLEGGLNFFLTPDPLFPGNMWSGVQDLVPQSVDGFRHSWQGPFFSEKHAIRSTVSGIPGRGLFFSQKTRPFTNKHVFSVFWGPHLKKSFKVCPSVGG